MSLLEIEGLTHSFGENLLYKNAGFTLNRGEHIGIVGQNGTGKSTLIKICTEQIIPDSGRIVWQPNTTIGYLDQYAEIDHTLTMKEFLKSAFTKLFEMEAQALQLYEKAADGDMKSLELAARYQEQLEAHDFYSIDTAIDRVANGLGLLAIGLDRPIAEMSGGQRAKVILAKLLLEKPDVLLLDEPTNFLELLKNIETAQVFEKSEVKVWECRNCGHIVVGTKAPEVCPVCNHPQSYFEVHEENY